ncbi:MAG: envelope stress response membrane protein PspC [Desulfarculaceae bacterium]|nr:envelope stress response membrane protein PspC [Desulfarculaceae bacterium]MCF8071293.1 envelope stress response membrane protein PspC [Desulfarculaceae bacterium]MCF8101618.1 envelope stress response membrane protein PspC [Desulfarculaceae bacterium]MCF8117442.1 envelope stress response membrane protein PspC [Desulfarculaceae bacterium]
MRLFDNLGRRGLYRSRRGALLGVCRGLAEYFDFSVTWVRVITVAAFIFTGIWPVGVLYLILALIMKPAPVLPTQSEDEEEFYHSYADSRKMALGRLKRTYDGLERRMRRLEDVVTSRDFDWERKVKN